MIKEKSKTKVKKITPSLSLPKQIIKKNHNVFKFIFQILVQMNLFNFS